MIRLLRLVLYYFSWQRTMAWTSGIGAAVYLLYFVVPPAGRFFVLIFGSVLALAFPAMFAGLAYRQLISNRRFVMVPQMKSVATAALLAFALICTLMAYLITDTGRNTVPQDLALDASTVAQLSFAGITAYLLLSQWLIVHALGGFIVLFLLPLAVIRVATSNGVLWSSLIANPWPLVALAAVGWFWLFVSVRGRALPRSMRPVQWEMGTSTDPAAGTRQWQPSFGPMASATGTLLRGVRDGWQNRVASASLALLTFPCAMLLVLWLIGKPVSDGADRIFPTGFFLVWSLFGIVMQAEIVFREWPARLRYLWLRRAGDRSDAWALLEGTLIREVLLIGTVAAVIAIAFAFLSETRVLYLVLYVVGCVSLALIASYFGMLARISGWHQIIETLLAVLLMLFVFGNVVFAQAADAPARIFWLAPIVLIVTVLFRWLARNRVLRADWCAIRPLRETRKRIKQPA